MRDIEPNAARLTLLKNVEIPEDLRAAFPFARVQKSLGNRDQRQARAAALDLDQVWDQRFAEARRAKGLTVTKDGPSHLDTTMWTWRDWEALATWFGASLAEEDWRARLSAVTGGAFLAEPDLAKLPLREASVVKDHITLGASLRSTTVSAYASSRLSLVQAHVRRLGIGLSRTNPEHERFMAACLKAELAYATDVLAHAVAENEMVRDAQFVGHVMHDVMHPAAVQEGRKACKR